MFISKMICTLLLPALVLVPATPVENATLENSANQNGDSLTYQQSKTVASVLPTFNQLVSGEAFRMSCRFCTNPDWPPIHKCTNGLSVNCFLSNFDCPVVKSVDNEPFKNGDEQKIPVDYPANRWAIGNVTGCEIVERITRFIRVEWLPVPLAAIPI